MLSITSGSEIITGNAKTVHACLLSGVDGDIAASVVKLQCRGANLENDLYTDSSFEYGVID